MLFCSGVIFCGFGHIARIRMMNPDNSSITKKLTFCLTYEKYSGSKIKKLKKIVTIISQHLRYKHKLWKNDLFLNCTLIPIIVYLKVIIYRPFHFCPDPFHTELFLQQELPIVLYSTLLSRINRVSLSCMEDVLQKCFMDKTNIALQTKRAFHCIKTFFLWSDKQLQWSLYRHKVKRYSYKALKTRTIHK